MTMRSIRIYKDVITREVARSRSTRQVLQPVAAKATRTGQQVAKERLTMRTRRYVNSFRARVDPPRGDREVARIQLENTAPYAGIIEQGSRPHVMPAKATLYVFDADDGTTVFTHGPIHHPGTQPERVIEVALKRVARGGGF
jgi:hypothetical protein